MEVICAQWNHDGSIVAIGGVISAEDKETNMIQFYDPRGQVSRLDLPLIHSSFF